MRPWDSGGGALEIKKMKKGLLQRIKNKNHLFVLEPRDAFGGKNEPVVARSTLHNTQIVYAHVAFANNLIAQSVTSRLYGILRGLLRTETEKMLYYEIPCDIVQFYLFFYSFILFGFTVQNTST